MSFAVRFASTLGRAMVRPGPRIARVVRRPFRFKPKLKSIPLSDLQKVMPRMFRRGYGVGGMLRRRRRRAGGRRIYRKKTQNRVHSFVRWCDKDSVYVTSALGPNYISETLADQHLTYQFKLDNVVNPSDFTNLYDSYKINKIQLFLEPLSNQTAYPSPGRPIQKKLRVVHDYTDATPLTNEDDYLEYSNCKSYNAIRNNAIKITLYPKIKNIIENVGGGANAYTTLSSNKVWLDMDSDEVPHFGLKIFVPGNIMNETNGLFNVRAKFWISCKNSK